LRTTIIFLEDLRKELLNCRLLLCLLLLQVVQCFLLNPGPGNLASTEHLLEEFFYTVSLAASMVFSIYGSAALTEEERLGTLQTLFLAPISLREYIQAKISFPVFSWLLSWCLLLLNICLARRWIGTVCSGDLLIAATALFLCVLSVMLFTVLVCTLTRDIRTALLLTLSLIFLHLVVIRPLYGIGPVGFLVGATWFMPFVHADRVWIWAFEKIVYARIAVSPWLEILWLGLFSLFVLMATILVLVRRYRRSIE